jgi:uncharacterized protein
MALTDNPDPVTADPSAVDRDYPPTIETVILNSLGARLNGLLYICNGPGPHPTAILLHGYPGDEKNLDLAQAMRRTGWNVLFFHYHGTWGSEGDYSIDNAIADVIAAHDFLKLPQTRDQLRVDAGRLALVGHSMGAYVAIIASAQLPSIASICFMAGINLAQNFMYPDYREAAISYFDTLGHGAVKGANWAGICAQMVADPARYDLLEHVSRLDDRRLLFIAATGDNNWAQNQLFDALKARNRSTLTTAEFDDDHVFSSHRIALARLITGWLSAG